MFLGFVAVIAIGGLLLAGLSPRGKPPAVALGPVPGSNIVAAAAKAALARIAVDSEPPADVVASLVIPGDATVTAFTRQTTNLELFSGSVTLATSHDATALTSFYRLELADNGWKVLRTDAAATGAGSETFADFPSSDGFYWEVEVLVTPANPSVTPALGGGDVTGSSTVVLKLVELNDQD